jgi:HlyD family secretion protein
MVQNVVTYDAIIEFANPEMKLFPGMTAYVTVPVASAEGVIKIPNAALHYRPALRPEEIRALYRQYGIAEAGAVERGGKALPEGHGSDPGSSADAATVVVWKRGAGDDVQPVEVELGITDHAFTAATRVATGVLKAGDALVTRAIQSRSSAPPGQGTRR